MTAKNPTPKAEIMPKTSHPTVLVAPTAAVARAPRAPTMAVSMYCTAVCITCSTMVGQAKPKMMAARARDSCLSNLGFIASCLSIGS